MPAKGFDMQLLGRISKDW